MNNFPKASSFDINLVRSKIMGPNPLKLCEELPSLTLDALGGARDRAASSPMYRIDDLLRRNCVRLHESSSTVEQLALASLQMRHFWYSES